MADLNYMLRRLQQTSAPQQKEQPPEIIEKKEEPLTKKEIALSLLDRPKKGRPKMAVDAKDRAVHFRMPESIFLQLEKVARREDLNVSHYIRRLIRKDLEKDRRKNYGKANLVQVEREAPEPQTDLGDTHE